MEHRQRGDQKYRQGQHRRRHLERYQKEGLTCQKDFAQGHQVHRSFAKLVHQVCQGKAGYLENRQAVMLLVKYPGHRYPGNGRQKGEHLDNRSRH
jgi:hypothetical protein